MSFWNQIQSYDNASGLQFECYRAQLIANSRVTLCV